MILVVGLGVILVVILLVVEDWNSYLSFILWAMVVYKFLVSFFRL